MSIPFIQSAVNGIKIPIKPGEVGMMWRYQNGQDNKNLIKKISGDNGVRDEDSGKLVIAGTQEAAPVRMPEAADPTPTRSVLTAPAPVAVAPARELPESPLPTSVDEVATGLAQEPAPVI